MKRSIMKKEKAPVKKVEGAEYKKTLNRKDPMAYPTGVTEATPETDIDKAEQKKPRK
jgi:hypothetical protein